MSNIFNSAVKSTYDIRDYTITADNQFPEAFCLDPVPVKNQGSKPTCTAHALSSAVEYHHQRQHGWYARFSTEFLYGLREKGYWIGHGMRIRDGLNTLLKYGNVYECDCEGNHDYDEAMNRVSKDSDRLKELAYPHRISAYFKIRSAEELKTALMEHGVAIVSMNTYDDHTLVNDVYTYDSTKDHGTHCVFIYGWNDKGWLVQNSWGYLYGGDGRFIVPFDFKFNEMWGISDDITDGVINKPKRNRILDVFYSLVNKLINLFIK
jgi:C1A family cysteine protease